MKTGIKGSRGYGRAEHGSHPEWSVPVGNGQRSETERSGVSGAEHSRRELTIPDGNPCGARPYPREPCSPAEWSISWESEPTDFISSLIQLEYFSLRSATIFTRTLYQELVFNNSDSRMAERWESVSVFIHS